MKPINSPWGKIQHWDDFGSPECGIYFVSTPGHGGVMMPKDIACEMKIQSYGIKFTDNKKQWICFEQDCQVAVAALACYQQNRLELSDSKIESAILSLAYWNPEYLDSIDLNSSQSEVQKIKEVKDLLTEDLKRIAKSRNYTEITNRMRNEHDPDLVISATRLNKLTDIERQLRSVPKNQNLDEAGRAADIYVAMEKELEFFQGNPEGVFSRGAVVLVYTADNRRHIVRNYDSMRDLNLLSLCDKVCSFTFD
jgi:hypothetical protein